MTLRALSSTARRRATWAALFAGHVAVMLYFVRPRALRAGPIVGGDWDMHVEQCMRAIDAWWSGYHTWGYDPQMLAGSLSGTIFDANNKMHEVVVVGLSTLGVNPATAFDTFVVVAHASVPLALYGAARLFDVSRVGATVAAVLASLLWFFDSAIHWGWWAGSLSWAFGAALSALPIALFYRWSRARRGRWLVATALGLGGTLLVHPYTFFAMVVPMVTVYLSAARRGLSIAEHLQVIGVGLLSIVVNLWWLLVALRFWHYVENSAYLGATSLVTLLWDYVGYLEDPTITGYIAVRTSFRFFTLGAAAMGLWRLRRAHDERAVVLGLAFGVPLALAYLGGHTFVVRQVQPMRFIFPAAFLATIVAGLELGTIARRFAELVRAPGAVAVMVLALVVALPKLALDVWYYFPQAIPMPAELLVVPRDPVGGAPDNAGLVWGLHRDYAHHPMGDDEWEIIDFVRRNDDGSARWLVEWPVLGERLAWSTKAQVLGGFPYVNMAHSDANWFRRTGAAPDPATLPAYIETYNVGWLVRTWSNVPELDLPDLFEHVGAVGGHQIYRRRVESSFVVGGTARVRASFNRIQVRGSTGGSLVLRYHFLETLVCRPGCRLSREPVATDRVGFLRVDDAPADFEIINGY